MKFETKKDRERQKKACDKFCNVFGLISVDKGEYSKVDYDLNNKNGYFIGSLEVKGCPDRKIDDALTCQVAMRKLIDLQKYQNQTKKPAAICWAFEDGIVYERIENLFGTFRMGGRKPREGSHHDIELMISVEIKNLTKYYY